jgi:hypothetical protein
MKWIKRSAFFTLFLMIAFFLNFCSQDSGLLEKEKKIRKPESRLVILVVGEGSKQMTVAFDIGKAKPVGEKGRFTLTGAIVDFSVPFNKLNTRLQRKKVAGEEVINKIEITDYPHDSQAALIIRLTTKGTGGGMGNIGISLVLAFNLDKDILSDKDASPIKIPCQGKLVSSKGRLKKTGEYVRGDLTKVGAKSGIYTQLVGVGDSDTSFNGFAVFDPTNEKSLKDAYFEFASSQSSSTWGLADFKTENIQKKE